MMKKRIIISVFLLFACLSGMAGCGEKSYFEGQEAASGEKSYFEGQEAASGDEVSLEEEPQEKELKETPPQEVIVKVYVYNDTDSRVVVEGAESTDRSGLVDINTATRDELMALSGIGGTKADAIISYRSEKGSFSKTEDIKNVSGIGEGTYEKIKEKITV